MSEPVVNTKLRVGLLVPSLEVPAWQELMVQRIVQSDAAEIVVVVFYSENQNGRWRAGGSAGWLAHRLLKIDERLFRPSVDAFSKRDLRSVLTSVPVFPVSPERGRTNLKLKSEDVKKLTEYGLDVLISLDQKRPERDILKAARHGVWMYDSEFPVGFKEVLRDEPQTVSSLIALRDGEPDVELYRSSSCTYRYSIRENCNRHHWRMAAFVPRALENVSAEKEAAFEKKNKEKSGVVEPHEASPLALLKCFSRNLKYAIYRQLFIEHWILLYQFSDAISYRFEAYRRLIPPKDRLWADPHVLLRDGKYYLFFEEMIFDGQKRGRIALIVFDENGEPGDPVTVLEEPHHLSYPFVFEWQNETYMIPETSGANAIRLYKCERFPDKWEFQHNLIDNIEGNDVTLYCDGARWWMFTSVKEHEGYPNWDELFLFYSDTPVSQSWQPHPKNPVVSDVASARPAGKLFEQNGEIYRPAQNSAYRYGYGLKIHRMIKLTETEYEEEEVHSFEPDWDERIKAVHSYNRAGTLSVIDARLRRLRYF